MPSKTSPIGYAVTFGTGLVGLTVSAVFAFWQVTGSEVRRSATEAAVRRAPVPVVLVRRDTTTHWQPTPEAAMLDSVFTLRSEGSLVGALEVLERWLIVNQDDRPLRLAAARLAFEARRRERGVFHYRRYLVGGNDRYILGEAVNRILSELPPADARRALASMLLLDDDDFPVRIGLARATAEASDPIGADSLLAPIPPHTDPRVDALRLLVRRAIVPDIPTAMRWVQEYPEEVLYRLVLARALGRGGRSGEALPHYLAAIAADTSLDLQEEAADVAVAADSVELASRLLSDVLARDRSRDRALLSFARARARLGDAAGAVRAFEELLTRNPSEALFTEARGVLFEVDDVRLTLPLLARLVAVRPNDDALRLRYAQDLERVSSFAEAEAQYGALLARVPSAPLLMSRARVRLAANDLTGAMADARASEQRAPTLEAAVVQGDIHRWRQERDASRLAYDRAARFNAGDAQLVEGRRLLVVQRREALAFEPSYGSAAATAGLGDSDGFDSFTLRAQQGFAPLADETVLIVGGEVRRATGSAGTPLEGIGGDVGFTRAFSGLTLLARAGAVAFDGGGPAGTALVEVSRRTRTLSVRGALSRQPAYESLRSGDVLAPDDVMPATSLLGSVSAEPRARLDIYAQVDHARLGDGNSRSAAAATARWAVRGPVAVLYTASAATFATGTVDYWSPQFFLTQGVGLDVRRDRPVGWSAGARLAPAIAWVRETAPGRPLGTNSALQATLSADATWRRRGLEVGLYGGYGQDRAGEYAAGFGGLRARFTR